MNRLDEIKYDLQILEEIINKQSYELTKTRNLLARVVSQYPELELPMIVLACDDNVEFDLRRGKLEQIKMPDGMKSSIEKINELKERLGL